MCVHKGGGELTARSDSGCSFVVFNSSQQHQPNEQPDVAEETVLWSPLSSRIRLHIHHRICYLRVHEIQITT